MALLLAISSDDDHNGKHYIHIYDFAKGTSTRVSDGGTEVFPVLSPDGKRVAYVGNFARTSQYIDVAATDGSGKPGATRGVRFSGSQRLVGGRALSRLYAYSWQCAGPGHS